MRGTARRIIDRYVLHEPIAVGGMATVFFAQRRGAAGFEKTVAIKQMRPDLVHQREFVELFLDEARLASRVDHANVVSVFDVVSDADELFIVMEYIHGESLAALMESARARGERLPPDIAVAIVAGALHGLHAAHEATDERREPLGIVHRDVSPHNLMVGVDGVARVADFGVAKATGQLHSTIEGRTRGKARYMAPEQLRGLPVTRQIDVFAASVVLWEALVGERLFERETDAAAMMAILQEPITAPGVLVPTLPEAIDDVVMRGLERDPKNRWATAQEMAMALEAALTCASPAVVGAWVMETAHATLEARERIMEKFSVGSVGSETEPDQRPSLLMDRRAWAIVAGVLIAVLFGPAAFRSLRGNSGNSTETRPSDFPEPVLEPLLPSATSDVASSEAPAASQAASASAGASAPIRRAPPHVQPKKGCDPPYDIDSAGHKRFKVGCL